MLKEELEENFQKLLQKYTQQFESEELIQLIDDCLDKIVKIFFLHNIAMTNNEKAIKTIEDLYNYEKSISPQYRSVQTRICICNLNCLINELKRIKTDLNEYGMILNAVVQTEIEVEMGFDQIILPYLLTTNEILIKALIEEINNELQIRMHVQKNERFIKSYKKPSPTDYHSFLKEKSQILTTKKESYKDPISSLGNSQILNKKNNYLS